MSTRHRLRPSDTVRGLVVLLLLIAIALPIYVTLVSGFFPTGSFQKYGLFPPLNTFTLNNFAQALQAIPIGRQYLTSTLVVILQASAEVIIGAMAAYALVFPTWRGRGIAFALILITLAVPGESLVIPNFELVTSMGLRDTVFGVVIPYLAVGYPIFLLRQAFASFPREVWEASTMDGCGDFRSLFLIVIPACRGHVTTAALWSALFAWNGFFWPLLITDSPDSRTVQVGLAQLAASETTNPAAIFAGTALVLVPTLVLTVCSQRLLVGGLARVR